MVARADDSFLALNSACCLSYPVARKFSITSHPQRHWFNCEHLSLRSDWYYIMERIEKLTNVVGIIDTAVGA